MINRTWIGLAMSLVLTATPLLPVLPAQAQSVYGSGKASAKNNTIRSGIAQQVSQVELTLGKAQILRLNQPAARVSVSNPDVVGVVLISPTEIQLTGKAIGVANMLVWSDNNARHYLTIDLSVHRDVSALARKIQMVDPGINILPVAAEDSVILTGVAESAEKAQLAYDLTKAFFASDPSSGGGAAAGAGGTGATGGPAAAGSSFSAGSASFAGTSTKIINMIKVKGQPSTKAELVQERLNLIDSRIRLNLVPGVGGREKAILTGRVKNASMVSKAVNLASVFYGQPGVKILTGPGGNRVSEGQSQGIQQGTGYQAGTGAGLLGNLSNNILQGAVISDTSENVISMLEVEERPKIKCSVKILEVQKSALRSFEANSRLTSDHLNVTTYAGGRAQAITDITSFFNQGTGARAAEVGIRYGQDFATFLAGLVQNGQARVLSEPTITNMSGEPASFLAGGEFPIPVSNVNGQITISYRQFGIMLNLLPTVTEQGTIHMQVTPEVSTLDPQAGITISGFNIPGLRTRRSQAVVEMRDGENFVLSGLYSDSMSNVVNKTPILGQIPILGNLFRSRDYQRNETELVIVLHPEILWDMNLSNTEATGRQAVQPNTDAAASATVAMVDFNRRFDGIKLPEKMADMSKLMASSGTASMKQAAVKPSRLSRAERKALKKQEKALKEMKTLSPPESSGAVENPENTATAPTEGFLFMTQPIESQADSPAKADGFMRGHQDALHRLISELEAPADAPENSPSEIQQPCDQEPICPHKSSGEPAPEKPMQGSTPVKAVKPSVKPVSKKQAPRKTMARKRPAIAKAAVKMKPSALKAAPLPVSLPKQAKHPVAPSQTSKEALQQQFAQWFSRNFNKG